jgi:hypothetical protein
VANPKRRLTEPIKDDKLAFEGDVTQDGIAPKHGIGLNTTIAFWAGWGIIDMFTLNDSAIGANT